ncbi:MAG TPA: hypothetical protein VKB09_01020 [Thermomicrobiales bacterium]|nr:hypothetical protein [Thermomicrobiales bacterium]
MTDRQTTDKGTRTKSERRYGETKGPKAPGAAASPQIPGQVPDRSTVPGHFSTRVPRPSGPVRRPLTQYGTAQEIMGVFPAPNEEAEKAEFEQATASVEELRKAYPWQLPPEGPTPVFALDQGVSPEPPALPAAQATPELGAGQERG